MIRWTRQNPNARKYITSPLAGKVAQSAGKGYILPILIVFLSIFLGAYSVNCFAGNFSKNATVDTKAQTNQNALELNMRALALDVDNTKLSLTQVEQSIAHSQRALQNYQGQLDMLGSDQNRDNTQLAYKKQYLQEKTANLKHLLALDHQRKENLINVINVLEKQLSQERSHFNTITLESAHTARLERERFIHTKIEDLGEKQNYWLNQVNSLNSFLISNPNLNSEAYAATLQKIFIAEENSNLAQFKINLLRSTNTIQSINDTQLDDVSIDDLNQFKQSLLLTIDTLEQTKEVVDKKIQLLNNRQTLLSTSTDAFNSTQKFIGSYKKILVTTDNLLLSAATTQAQITTEFAKTLAKRQGLPGLSLEKWGALLDDMVNMSNLSYEIALTDIKSIYAKISSASLFFNAGLLLLLCLSIGSYYFIRAILNWANRKIANFSISLFANFLKNASAILLSHLWFIVFFITTLIFLSIVNLSNDTWNIVFHLGNCLLALGIGVSTIRKMFHTEMVLPDNHRLENIRLFKRLCWLFLFGFLSASLMFLAQDLDTSYVAQDMFARLFMLFVFIVGVLLLKGWKTVPQVLLPLIHERHSHLIRMVKFLAIIIPLVILSTGILGLFGFVNLAWTFSHYEVLFLIVAVGYFLLRGICNQLMRVWADNVIRYRSGWIISEAFLKPLSLWLHILLFLSACWVLIYLYGFSNQPLFLKYFHAALHFPLIQFSNHPINLWLLSKAIIASMFFIWATKWSREFCYRKLYRRVKDLGARNSLAIFSQYSVVVIGALSVLKILQIDLTTLTFIATGLALGVGLGLRDLANNFISGLLILIERPMRRGDTVTVGDYNGTVHAIGIRAITILGGDNKEIVVPNSEIFSKTFINWTRQDDVVRYSVHIKLHWEDHPQTLCSELKKVVMETEGVLNNPEPAILLASMSDGLLELEIRFYIHYNLTSSAEASSRVLFNILNHLKSENIHPAYPTQNILLNKESEDAG